MNKNNGDIMKEDIEDKNVEQKNDVELKENEDVSNEVEKKELNPFIEYILEIFHPNHVMEFLNSLDENQKFFVETFISGFECGLGRQIIGVYDTEYLKNKKLTNELFTTLKFGISTFVRKEDGLSFTIVWRLS